MKNVRVGHANKGKGSAPSMNVGHVVRSVRCLSPQHDETDRSKFLCFQVSQVRCPTIGMATAPWAFTKIVKQIKKWASPRRYVLFQYLDDWLNVHGSRETLICMTHALLLEPSRQKKERTRSASPSAGSCKKENCFFVEAESLLGSLVFMVPTVPLSRLILRPLQQQVILCVMKGRQFAQQIRTTGLLTDTLR